MDFKIVDIDFPNDNDKNLIYYNSSINLVKEHLQEAIEAIECFNPNENLIDKNTNLPLNCELITKFKYILTLIQDLECIPVVKSKNMEDK